MVKNGLKLRVNDNGVEALKVAKDIPTRKRIVEILFDEFKPDFQKGDGTETIEGAISRAIDDNAHGKYNEFIDELITMRRNKIGDAGLLSEVASIPEIIPIIQKTQSYGSRFRPACKNCLC